MCRAFHKHFGGGRKAEGWKLLGKGFRACSWPTGWQLRIYEEDF